MGISDYDLEIIILKLFSSQRVLYFALLSKTDAIKVNFFFLRRLFVIPEINRDACFFRVTTASITINDFSCESLRKTQPIQSLPNDVGKKVVTNLADGPLLCVRVPHYKDRSATGLQGVSLSCKGRVLILDYQ